MPELITETSNPQSVSLSSMNAAEIVDLMNREDEKVVSAVRRALPQVSALSEEVARLLRAGGRLVYVGAGTSGRLGVLDAAECPPTFGTDPGQVLAVIAGGAPAVTRAVENAEDSAEAGASELQRLGINCSDVVVGISASGTTPFVLGAVNWAREQGIVTGSVFCNSGVPLQNVDFPICVEVGAEVLRGSTRLKAGTATKMVLNMISTSVMVALGHCLGNLMVDVCANNAKLVKRQESILAEIAGISVESARELLQKTSGKMREAIELARRD